MFATLPSKRLAAASAAAPSAAARPLRPATIWMDPLPLPEVVEDDSDAAWALWQSTVQGQSNQDADTVLMGLSPV